MKEPLGTRQYLRDKGYHEKDCCLDLDHKGKCIASTPQRPIGEAAPEPPKCPRCGITDRDLAGPACQLGGPHSWHMAAEQSTPPAAATSASPHQPLTAEQFWPKFMSTEEGRNAIRTQTILQFRFTFAEAYAAQKIASPPHDPARCDDSIGEDGSIICQKVKGHDGPHESEDHCWIVTAWLKEERQK